MNTNIEISQMKNFFLHKKEYNEDNEENEDNENYTSKTDVCDFFSINEIQISEIIEQIPNYVNYYDILYDYDIIQIGELNETVLEKSSKNIQEKYLLFEFKKRNFIQFNDFLFNSKKPQLFILRVLNSFSSLLTSLIHLNNKNICFFNLSSENIVFDLDSGEKPILINFKKSLQFKKMTDEYISKIIEKTENFTNKPFEVHVLFYLICNKLETISHSFIEEISERYIKNLTVLKLFSQAYKENFKLLCSNSLQKYINKPSKYIINDIIERTSKTWDSYSLSILYLHIFGTISKVFSLKDTFITRISIELAKNINPEPSKRDSLEKTLEKYEKLFYNYNDWSFVKKIPPNRIEMLFEMLLDT
jgi:hypothetical protein